MQTSAMTNQSTNLAADDNDLSCVLIPVLDDQLLLPNVSVAEIVPWRRLRAMTNGPDWCLGHVGWRGQTLPVLHFGGFSGHVAPEGSAGRCLVVMNRARNPSAPSFYAFASQGLPRMVALEEDDLGNRNIELGPADVMRVQVGTEAAVIPDLAFIEQELYQLHRALNG
ncbi:MAG: chemotaxis protein CheW [Pseudomonadota bacterium]